MSNTPRTDAAEHNMGSVVEPHYVVDVDCSRQLERELAEAKAEIVRLKGEAESWEKVFDRTCELLAEAKTAPPRKEWVGLTAEDMADAHNSTSGDVMMRLAGFARSIEAKLKDKNGG